MPKRGISRDEVLAAIRQAAQKLGRAPSRVELKLAGMSHFKVLNHFPSLRQAVREAGLEPNRKGMRIANRDLLDDYGRVAAKVGGPPSRSEYEREGRYSPGAFYRRFGNWRAVEDRYYRINPDQGDLNHRGHRETQRKEEEAPCTDQATDWVANVSETREHAEKLVAIEWGAAMQALPAPLQGKKRVTEAICMMIVNTLMGADSRWQEAMRMIVASSTTEGTEGHRGKSNGSRGPNLGKLNLSRVGGKLDRERPVMGPPFFPGVMTNAPDNEMGVMLLFGLLAGELGFQIESARGRYPDVIARRQVRPGKWQQVRIELEYESRSFAMHKHDPSNCDVIVCWRHNWKGCPEEIEVIELRRILGIG